MGKPAANLPAQFPFGSFPKTGNFPKGEMLTGKLPLPGPGQNRTNVGSVVDGLPATTKVIPTNNGKLTP